MPMRKNFLRAAFFAAITAASLGAGAQESDSQGARAAAKAHFERGLAAIKTDEYDAAARELEASVGLSPTKAALFNLAGVYKVLSRYDEALAAIARLEREFDGKIDPAMRRAAAEMKGEIERFVARLDIRVRPAAVNVFVDGIEIEKERLAGPFSMNPGRHVIRAECEGCAAREEKVQLLSGQVVRVELSLEPLEPSVDAAENPPPAISPPVPVEPPPAVRRAEASVEERPTRKKLGRAPFFVAGALAVGAGVATIVLGVEADAKEEDGLSRHDQSIIDDAKPLQTAGRVTLGLALGAGAAAAVLAFFTDFKGEKKESPVAVGVAPNGLLVEGRF